MSQVTGRFFWTCGQSRENEMIVVGNLSFWGGGFFWHTKTDDDQVKVEVPQTRLGYFSPLLFNDV